MQDKTISLNSIGLVQKNMVHYAKTSYNQYVQKMGTYPLVFLKSLSRDLSQFPSGFEPYEKG